MEETKVLFTASIFSSSMEAIDKACDILESPFGKVISASEIYDCDQTGYYKDQMGENLKKKIVIFENLKPLQFIGQEKLRFIEYEKYLAKEFKFAKRPINIDPGFIDLYRFALFSTKDAPHRVHLHDGIYQENTLIYYDDQWNDHKFTYPDYKQEFIKEFLKDAREIYKKKLKDS